MCLIVTHKQSEAEWFVNKKFYKILLKCHSGIFRSLIKQNYIWKLGINKFQHQKDFSIENLITYNSIGKLIATEGLHVFTKLEECRKEYERINSITEFDMYTSVFEPIVVEVFGNHEDLIAFGNWEETNSCAAFTKLRVDSFKNVWEQLCA